MNFTFLFVFVGLQENRLARPGFKNIHPVWLNGAEQGVADLPGPHVRSGEKEDFAVNTLFGTPGGTRFLYLPEGLIFFIATSEVRSEMPYRSCYCPGGQSQCVPASCEANH